MLSWNLEIFEEIRAWTVILLIFSETMFIINCTLFKFLRVGFEPEAEGRCVCSGLLVRSLRKVSSTMSFGLRSPQNWCSLLQYKVPGIFEILIQ